MFQSLEPPTWRSSIVFVLKSLCFAKIFKFNTWFHQMIIGWKKYTFLFASLFIPDCLRFILVTLIFYKVHIIFCINKIYTHLLPIPRDTCICCPECHAFMNLEDHRFYFIYFLLWLILFVSLSFYCWQISMLFLCLFCCCCRIDMYHIISFIYFYETVFRRKKKCY